MNTKDVIAITGATQRQLQWWDEQGIVCPLRRAGARVYTEHEMLAVKLVLRWRLFGYGLGRIRILVAAYRKTGSSGGSRLHYVCCDGKTVHVATQISDVIAHAARANGPVSVVELA